MAHVSRNCSLTLSTPRSTHPTQVCAQLQMLPLAMLPGKLLMLARKCLAWPLNACMAAFGTAAAYSDAMARKKVLKVITMFGSPYTDPREKIYAICSALSRGHPIVLGIR